MGDIDVREIIARDLYYLTIFSVSELLIAFSKELPTPLPAPRSEIHVRLRDENYQVLHVRPPASGKIPFA